MGSRIIATQCLTLVTPAFMAPVASWSLVAQLAEMSCGGVAAHMHGLHHLSGLGALPLGFTQKGNVLSCRD